MKNTIFYEIFSKSYPVHHFNVINTFRNSYLERFRINGYDGFFSWYRQSENNEIYFTKLKKGNFILTEILKKDNNNILNMIDIKNIEENVIISVKKEVISSKLNESIKEKNDSHIISCGCCKRPIL